MYSYGFGRGGERWNVRLWCYLMKHSPEMTNEWVALISS